MACIDFASMSSLQPTVASGSCGKRRDAIGMLRGIDDNTARTLDKEKWVAAERNYTVGEDGLVSALPSPRAPLGEAVGPTWTMSRLPTHSH